MNFEILIPVELHDHMEQAAIHILGIDYDVHQASYSNRQQRIYMSSSYMALFIFIIFRLYVSYRYHLGCVLVEVYLIILTIIVIFFLILVLDMIDDRNFDVFLQCMFITYVSIVIIIVIIEVFTSKLRKMIGY